MTIYPESSSARRHDETCNFPMAPATTQSAPGKLQEIPQFAPGIRDRRFVARLVDLVERFEIIRSLGSQFEYHSLNFTIGNRRGQ